MNSIYFIGVATVLTIIELLYFRLAGKFDIVDHPNFRSSHEKPTVRGGGIIFFIATLIYAFTGESDPLFLLALTAVAVIGFWDDVRNLPSSIRFAIQALSFLILFHSLGLLVPFTWLILPFFLISLAALNAFNFMDGINGLTGGYGLLSTVTLYSVNASFHHFIDGDFLIVMMISLSVFSFFNFREKAVCFAGDVGSTSIGFILLYVVILLILGTHNLSFILFFAVYGVDAGLTIIHRILRKENIFKSHRLHFYQVAVHHLHISHVRMSLIYLAVQGVINLIAIYSLQWGAGIQIIVFISVIMSLSVAYVLLKPRFMRGPVFR